MNRISIIMMKNIECKHCTIFHNSVSLSGKIAIFRAFTWNFRIMKFYFETPMCSRHPADYVYESGLLVNIVRRTAGHFTEHVTQDLNILVRIIVMRYSGYQKLKISLNSFLRWVMIFFKISSPLSLLSHPNMVEFKKKRKRKNKIKK